MYNSLDFYIQGETLQMKQLTYKHTTLACYIGYITQAIGINFMPILFTIFKEEFSLSYSELGSLVVINFVTQILTDIFSTKYVDRLGFRRTSIPCQLLCFLGLMLLCILPSVMANSFLALAIATIVYAVGGGMVEVIISPIIDSMPSDDSTGAMSLLHSFYCWGQLGIVLLTTLAIKLCGNDVWRPLALILSLIPLINMLLFIKVPLPETENETRTPIKALISNKAFLAAMILMVGAGAAEQVIAQWSSLFAQTGLGVDKTLGDILGPSLFAVFMIIGRTYFGVMGERLDLRRSLLYSSVLCIFCYIVTALSASPLLALAGCALTGLSVSLMWPGMLSLASSKFPHGGAAMFGVLAIFGDLGCSIGPMLTGFISDFAQKLPVLSEISQTSFLTAEQISLKAGIFSGIIFPVIMIPGLIILKEKKGSN